MSGPPLAIAQLSTRSGELRDLLVRWAEINSGSDNPAGLAKMASALAAGFSPLGIHVETVPLKGALAPALRVRKRPGAARQILLSGHFDTVYGSEHPFQRCDQPAVDRLRGPGVADMKGGLVVMLAALQAFEGSEPTGGLGWEVLLSPDEETGSAASAVLLQEAATRHHLSLIFEPARANGDLVKSRKGTGIFTIVCRGRSAHAGRDPEAGRNAILALAEFLPKANALNSEIPGVLLNVGNIRGGGAVNIVPDYAQAEINIRVTRTDDQGIVLGRLQELAGGINAREGYHLEITGRFNRPPKETTPTEERLFNLWKKCGADTGSVFSWQHVGGGSDGNILGACGLPVLDGLGVVGDHLHSPEESMVVSSLAERAQVAALFLHRVDSGEISLP